MTYDEIFEAINEKYEDGEYSYEQAEEMNRLAYEKFGLVEEASKGINSTIISETKALIKQFNSSVKEIKSNLKSGNAKQATSKINEARAEIQHLRERVNNLDSSAADITLSQVKEFGKCFAELAVTELAGATVEAIVGAVAAGTLAVGASANKNGIGTAAGKNGIGTAAGKNALLSGPGKQSRIAAKELLGLPGPTGKSGLNLQKTADLIYGKNTKIRSLSPSQKKKLFAITMREMAEDEYYDDYEYEEATGLQKALAGAAIVTGAAAGTSAAIAAATSRDPKAVKEALNATKRDCLTKLEKAESVLNALEKKIEKAKKKASATTESTMLNVYRAFDEGVITEEEKDVFLSALE